MVSQRTTLAVAEAYAQAFVREVGPRTALQQALIAQIGEPPPMVDGPSLRDYLFERNYQPWLYEYARSMTGQMTVLTEFIIGLHSGSNLTQLLPNYTWDQRQNFGRQYIISLACTL